jgi:hypothetical protein
VCRHRRLRELPDHRPELTPGNVPGHRRSRARAASQERKTSPLSSSASSAGSESTWDRYRFE